MMRSMIVERLEKLVIEALRVLEVDTREVLIEHPKDPTHGDFATNVALIYAKKLSLSPREFAEKLLAEIVKLN